MRNFLNRLLLYFPNFVYKVQKRQCKHQRTAWEERPDQIRPAKPLQSPEDSNWIETRRGGVATKGGGAKEAGCHSGTYFFLLILLNSLLPQFYLLRTTWRCCWAESAAHLQGGRGRRVCSGRLFPTQNLVWPSKVWNAVKQGGQSSRTTHKKGLESTESCMICSQFS